MVLHEIKEVEYIPTQYNWETSGVNVVEVYQQAFLTSEIMIRSVVRYVDIQHPHHIKEEKYIHKNDEKISIKDFFLKIPTGLERTKMFVRSNSSGFDYLIKPKLNFTNNIGEYPRNKILYDSRFPGQSHQELPYLSV